MANSQIVAIGVIAFTMVLPNIVSSQTRSRQVYDYRPSAEYRSLDTTSKARLDQVVKDFATLETALNKYVSVHHGQPPESLDELVPNYLPSLPRDPFASPNGQIPNQWQHYKQSLGGAGYLYQRRRGPVCVTSWKKPIKVHTLNGSWRFRSVGLPSFPLRHAARNGRGLIRAKGYWGRMLIDVF